MLKHLNDYEGKRHINRKAYEDYLVLLLIVCVSFFSFLYFFQNGQHILYGDALSRLNISRKLIDNLTPGFAQLGNVWLPLPQILMLPFIWNGYMWHSGLAGSIMSMTAFILGGIFLFKTAKLLTNSTLNSLIVLSIYALNINLLYLQTTAMSEPLFISASIGMVYFFLKWTHTKSLGYLILLALSVNVVTLTRYEGLAILFSSVAIVLVFSLLVTKKRSKAEGNVIVYFTLALLGFALWTVYLATIFGDPFYWKNYYAASITTAEGSTVKYAQGLSLFPAVWKYFTSIVWMNGLIPVIYAICGYAIIVYKSLKNKSLLLMPFLVPAALYLFMVLTLMRNTPIGQPDLNITNVLSPDTSYIPEFNIRYGLIMLPWIALGSSFLFAIKYKWLKILIFLFFGIQLFSYLRPIYTIIYQIPISISGNNTQGTQRDKALVTWLKKNYDGGLIMISALKHDPQMFQLGYDYKTYIHEGTGMYWKKSIKDPTKYAKWIVMDNVNRDDQVTKYLKNSKSLKKDYDLVYNVQDIKIYKIKK